MVQKPMVEPGRELLALQWKMAWVRWWWRPVGRKRSFASYDSSLGGEEPPGTGSGQSQPLHLATVGEWVWTGRGLVGPLLGSCREGGLVGQRTPHHAAGATEARVAGRGAGTLPERAVDGRGGMGLTSGAMLTVVSGLARGNGEEVVTTLFLISAF